MSVHLYLNQSLLEEDASRFVKDLLAREEEVDIEHPSRDGVCPCHKNIRVVKTKVIHTKVVNVVWMHVVDASFPLCIESGTLWSKVVAIDAVSKFSQQAHQGGWLLVWFGRGELCGGIGGKGYFNVGQKFLSCLAAGISV